MSSKSGSPAAINFSPKISLDSFFPPFSASGTAVGNTSRNNNSSSSRSDANFKPCLKDNYFLSVDKDIGFAFSCLESGFTANGAVATRNNHADEPDIDSGTQTVSVCVIDARKDEPHVCVLRSIRLHSVVLNAPLMMDDSACDHFIYGRSCEAARLRRILHRNADTSVFCPLNSSAERLFLQRRRQMLPSKVKRILMTLDGCHGKTGVYKVNSSGSRLSPDGLFCKRLSKEMLLNAKCIKDKVKRTLRVCEALEKTFSYLDIVSLCRCAQVCKYWNLLALDGSNWQRVDLFQFQKDIKGSVVENLAKRYGRFLKALCLRGCEGIQDGALETLHNLGTHCKQLKVLNMDCVSLISNGGLKAISNGCPNLGKLNVSWCRKVDDSGLAAIAHGCSMLQALICKGCSQVSDEGIKEIAHKCNGLRVLNLRNCSFITDLSVSYLSEGCKLLEYLCLSMCPRITDRSIQSLAGGCQLLKDLELARCNQLTDIAFYALSKNCHYLERLDLEDCNLITDNTLCYLAQGCPNLTELSCSHCNLLTDNGIKQLCLGLSVNDRLRVLELDNCPLISDGVLGHLKEFRTLQRVELYDCQSITRAAVRRFKEYLPDVTVHAYFAPVHQEQSLQPNINPRDECRCCCIM